MSPWITLSDALALARISEGQLVDVLLAGDIRVRGHNGDGTTEPFLPANRWVRANIDWPNSHVSAKSPPWFRGRVEINRQDLLDYFRPDRQQVIVMEETRGRRASYDWEQAGLEIFGRIYRGEIHPEPKKPKDILLLYTDWFAARDLYPQKSDLYEHVNKLFKVLRSNGESEK
jgi:hypothetical protein